MVKTGVKTVTATYTMGFQLGSGLGAIVWGATIEHFGYSVTFACTFVPMLAAIILVLAEGRPLTPRRNG